MEDVDGWLGMAYAADLAGAPEGSPLRSRSHASLSKWPPSSFVKSAFGQSYRAEADQFEGKGTGSGGIVAGHGTYFIQELFHLLEPALETLYVAEDTDRYYTSRLTEDKVDGEAYSPFRRAALLQEEKEGGC